MRRLIFKCLKRNFFIKQLSLNYIALKALKSVHKRYPTATFGKNVDIINPNNLILGENVSFQDNIILHNGGLDWCNFTGGIELGDGSVISPNCLFWGCGAKIKIGKNFDCGPGVKIFASRTKYEELKNFPALNSHHFDDVIIGDNVIIFANVVISPGVTIGDGAVIGANSTVLKCVESNTVVAGSPAKFIKNRV